MNHDDVLELAADYLLNQTDAGTRARIAEHLHGCPGCRAEFQEIARVLDAVGRSVPEVEPPPSLRAKVVAIPSPATPRTSLLPWSLAAAAALMAGVALWQVSSLTSEVASLRQQLADGQRRAAEREIERIALERQVNEFTRQAAVLNASDVVAYTLVGSGGAAGARARAYVTQKHGMVFTADGLPALPAGKVYQLWVIVGNKPVSAGVFSPDSAGHVHAVMATPDIASMPGVVAVTLEPQGGLAQPSTSPILVGTPG